MGRFLRGLSCCLIVLSLLACEKRPELVRARPKAVATPDATIRLPAAEVSFVTSAERLAEVPPQRMLQVVRSQLVLKPDIRILGAAAEIAQILDPGRRRKLVASFQAESWTLDLDGSRVGALSRVSSFEESLNLLRRWAGVLAAKAGPFRGSNPPAPDLAALRELAGNPFSSGPFTALRRVDELWGSGSRTPELLEIAGRSLLVLRLQAIDRLGMADPIEAKALAVLALREATSGKRFESDEAELASAMGYPSDEETLADRLAPDSPIRLWILGTPAALRASAEAPGSSALTRYLALLALAREFDLPHWTEWVAKYCSAEPRGLPLLRTALDLPDFGPDPELAQAVLEAVFTEVGDEKQASELWKRLYAQLLSDPATARVVRLVEILRPSVPPAGILKRFERTLAERMPAGGAFWDRETSSAYYRCFFYSALWKAGVYELDRRSSGPDALAFAKFLEDADPGPGADFQRWFADLARFMTDRATLPRLLEDLDGLPSLGQPAILRVGNELLAFLPENDPRRGPMLTRFARRLDGRSSGLAAFPNLCWQLHDLGGYQYYREATARLGPRRYHDADYGYALFFNDAESIRRIAGRPDIEGYVRVWALITLEQEKMENDAFVAPRLVRLCEENPRNTDMLQVSARYLRRHGHAKEAETLLRRWVAIEPSKSSLTHAFWAERLALVLRTQGRCKEGWTVVEPWISTWKGDVLTEGAATLECLGRHEEAVEMARRGLDRYPDNLFSRVAVAEILWRQKKFADVPPLFKDPKFPPAPRDWVDEIAPDFFEIFKDSPSADVLAAFQPIRDGGFNPWLLMEFTTPFAKAGRNDLAFEMLDSINRKTPGIGALDPSLNLYRYRKVWKGDAEALAWVKGVVTPATAIPVMRAALEQRMFELMWAFDVPGDPKSSEEAWLLRACAAAIDPKSSSEKRAELEAHFRSSGQGPKDEYGRYLLAMSDDAALYRIAADPLRRGEAAYYFGIKAVGDGRYEDASDWFRVCLEVPPAYTAESAKTVLTRWVTKGKALEVLRRERYF